MPREEIDAVLTAAEAALAQGDMPDMGAFWRAVGAVKREPALVEAFADRIGAIDQAAFARWAPLRVPLWVGTALMTIASVVGVGLLVAAAALDDPWDGLAVLAATGILDVSVHGLTHLAVGAIAGIRFTAWFLLLRRPQPGVKTDYASYLRTPATSRAWMHASGAIATKAVPFLVVPVAVAVGAPGWSVAAVVILGVAQLATDALWSVKSSDWKKFRRERAIGRSTSRPR